MKACQNNDNLISSSEVNKSHCNTDADMNSNLEL